MTNGPDLSALAADMLKWERMKRACDELEQAIKDTVMQLEQTQTVGNVRATYSGGRKTYDYTSIADHPLVSRETVLKFTTSKVDWRAVAKHDHIDDIPYTESSPSVYLKLLA